MKTCGSCKWFNKNKIFNKCVYPLPEWVCIDSKNLEIQHYVKNELSNFAEDCRCFIELNLTPNPELEKKI